MHSLVFVKTAFVVSCAVVAMILAVATHRERRRPLEHIRSEYAMPRIIGYGLAVLFALMSLNELGHLLAYVRTVQP